MSDASTEIKRLIIRSGMTTSQIAGRAKCHSKTIDFWLSGRTKEPSLAVLVRVAGVFGRRIEIVSSGARLSTVPDTPAAVAAKAERARTLWRRYQ